MSSNLNLYAKIENLIGFDEAYFELYDIYLDELEKYNIKSLLDLGCGNGNFLIKVENIYDALGIDLSSEMIEIAKKKGVDVLNIELSDLDKRFDAIVAIGDVVNYIKYTEIKKFFRDIEDSLNKNGIFICDLNTLHGFEEVTAGSMVVDRDDEFMSIDAEYLNGVLRSEIIYFKKYDNCYKKEKEEIFQYYYTQEELDSFTSMKMIKIKSLNMFSDESDKNLYIFKKVD